MGFCFILFYCFLLLSDSNCGKNVECLKNALYDLGFIQSHLSWIRKWISHQNNLTLAVQKNQKTWSYIQAFIK